MRPADQFRDGEQDEALSWFVRWRSGQMTAAQHAAAEAWLRKAPENREAFAEISAIWSGMEPARQHPMIMVLREKATRRVARAKLGFWLRTAAAILVVAGVGLGGYRWLTGAPETQPVVYATRVGQTSTVNLADGSKVILDTDSVMKAWPRMVTERRFELVRGRAFFEVAKDRSRPFIVRTDRGSVTALGTAFDVRRDEAGMKIVLLEGRVRIQPSAAKRQGKTVEMVAGHEFVGDGSQWRLTKTDSEAETSWIRGDLIFDEQPLATIVEELNRYGTEKIVIGDMEVGRRRLSAVLKAGDNKPFLASVETLGLARVKRLGGGEVVLVAPL